MVKTFLPDEVLTAADVNAHLVNDPTRIWTGKLPGDTGALTASNYTSFKPSTLIATTGDLTPVWVGDTFTVPETGWYDVQLQVTFASSSTGNRLLGLLKNMTTDTYNSSSAPSSSYRVRWFKTAPSSDTTSVSVRWVGQLTPTDKIMPMARATVSVALLGANEETSLAIVQLKRGI